MSEMSLRSGVHKELEAAADEILREHLSGITKHSDKSDVLTPWKEQDRRSREVYVPSGTPDPALREGNYHRSWNPSHSHLNSVPSGAASRRKTSTPSTMDLRETNDPRTKGGLG